MGRLESIRATATNRQIVEGQALHLGLIILMVPGALALFRPAADMPTFLGWTAVDWAIASVLLAVLHQVVVALVFRLQLYRGLMTRVFGDKAMTVWAAIFLPLLIARPLTILIVGWQDTEGLTGLRWIELPVGLALIGLALVTLHSVVVHFTVRRALGADHFDDAVIAMPLVSKGMFKYTDNAMYGLVFLGLWGVALAFGSWNALIVALFQHTYIWVHMYLTEAPDMARIYGED